MNIDANESGPRLGSAARVAAIRSRLLFDLSTSLAWRDRHAVGIVRTERELARHLMARPDTCFVPVASHSDGIRALDPDMVLDLLNPATASASAERAPDRLEAPPRVARRGWLALLLRPFALTARAIVRGLLKLLPSHVRHDASQCLVMARQVARGLLYRPHAQPAPEPAPGKPAAEQTELPLIVHPPSADILFLAGLHWDVVNWQRVAELRARAVWRVVSVMYDMIPIKFPEFVGTPRDGYYFNCFLHLIDNSDLIFCVSRRTEADLIEFIAASGRPPVRTEVLYLGSDLPASPDATAITDPEIRERLSRGRFALTVGTFEIRKNYPLLLDVWEELLANPEFDLDLVIVGMPGWRVDDVIQRLRALPGFGTRILWFERMSDVGVSWLYERCHLFLFPSLYEGWGLPVVEALQHGRPVIASNRGATPEATFGLATMLDPEDRAAWRAALLAAANEPRRTVMPPPGALPTWEKAAAAVAQTLAEFATPSALAR